MRDTLLLLSGGLDSITLAHHLTDQGRLSRCVFFRYGQPAVEYEESAASKFGCPLHVIDLHLDGMFDMLSPPGWRSPRIVPARNLVLIARAANLAAQCRDRFVAIGATAGDRNAYVDCQAGWLDALSRLTDAACGVQVIAPFVEMTKAQVVGRARELGVQLEGTWSCYAPADGKPCERCNACVERAVALV